MTAIKMTSLITPTTMTEIDPYGVNPLADDYRSAHAYLYAKAQRLRGTPPKLFVGGASDLPPFTASGVDPVFVGWLPVGVRHAAAAVPTEEQFADLVNRCGADPHARADHPGLEQAIARMRSWATGAPPATTPTVTAPEKPHGRPRGREKATTTTYSLSAIREASKRGDILPRRR